VRPMRQAASICRLVAMLLALGCGLASAEDRPPQLEKEVKEFLDSFMRAYEKKDISALMNMIAPEGDVVFFDTGTNARFVGKQQIREAYEADLKSVQSVTGEFTWVSIGPRGDLAWFATEMAVRADTGQVKFRRNGFWTGVLEKRDNRWQLVMSHFSFGGVEPFN
jgi:uncharacterized protein (TIGR02246 family)